MKKNMAMRAAGVLFVATMLSTSIISGTYAKYVTEGSAEDKARVAAFGVKVEADGSLFSQTYTGTSANGNTITVQSSAAYNTSAGISNVVAPGTSNADGLALSVSGTPEVDVQVVYALDADATQDIFLKAGTYPDMTTAAPSDTFVLADDYHPIVWTLTIGDDDPVTGSLAEITDALKELSDASVYDAGTDLSDAVESITLKWNWAFSGNDKADTMLGDLAAGAVTSDNGTYSLDTAIKFTVTVTQID